MKVHFTPEQGARLATIAAREGIDRQELVKDAALGCWKRMRDFARACAEA